MPVVEFKGRRQQPPPPPRTPRVIVPGVVMGGVHRPCTMITGHREELIPLGIDSVMPIAYIAVRDRANLMIGIPNPYNADYVPANDKE